MKRPFPLSDFVCAFMLTLGLAALIGCSNEETPAEQAATIEEPERPRVMIIGLDGGTWDVIMPLVEDGLLPNIKEILDNGAYGRLFSERSYSAPSWTSIFTGHEVRDHGVFDFTFGNEWNVATFGRGDIRFHNTSIQRDVPALWNHLSDAGLRTGVIGSVITYPPEKFEGFMVTGDGTPYIIFESLRNLSSSLTAPVGWASLPEVEGMIKQGSTELADRPIHFLAIDRNPQDDRNVDTLLIYEDKAGSEPIAELNMDQPVWIEWPLDARGSEVLRTATDVVPVIQPANQWENVTGLGEQPLEIVFPSGITSLQHGKLHNNPLFFLVTRRQAGTDAPYDEVQVSYDRDGRGLRPSYEAFRLNISPSVRPLGISGGIEVQLKADGYDVPFFIRSSGKAGPSGPVFIGSKGGHLVQVSGPNDMQPWFDWVMNARKAAFGTEHGILSYIRLELKTLNDGTLSIHTNRRAYNHFDEPLYPYSWPPALLAEGPPEPLLDGFTSILRHQDFKAEAARRLVKNQEWDLLIQTYTKIDLIMHGVWNDPDPRHADPNPYNGLIREGWQKVDDYVGELVAAAPENTHVILCSDHGFKPIYDRRRMVFLLDEIFEETGWMTRTDLPDQPQPDYGVERDVYEVTYVWRLDEPVPNPAKVNLLMRDEDGRVVHRFRHRPGHGAFPTTKWEVGQIVEVTYALTAPYTLPKGTYTLSIDLNGQSLMTDMTTQERIGSLGTIEVTEEPDPSALILPKVWNRISDVTVHESVEAAFDDDEGEEEAWDFRNVNMAGPMTLLGFRKTVNRDYPALVQFNAASIDRIDWRKTRAYPISRQGLYSAPPTVEERPPNQGIYINLMGREPNGSVPQLEYKDTVDELVRFLASWRIKETGEKFFRRVSGLNQPVAERPDVQFTVSPSLLGPVVQVDLIDFQTYDPRLTLTFEQDGEEFNIPLSRLASNQVLGAHGTYGIFAVSGPQVSKRGPIPVMNEVDVTPTVMKLLGMPIPAGLDGRVIEYPFEFDVPDALSASNRVFRTADDEAKFEELKSIGYIGAMQERGEKIMAEQDAAERQSADRQPAHERDSLADEPAISAQQKAPQQANCFEPLRGAHLRNGPGELLQPRGIAEGLDGELYVADFGNHRIQVFDAGGEFLREWGVKGDAVGEFNNPTALAVGSQNRLWVCDTFNHRVQAFDAEGNSLRVLTKDDYGFFAPRGVAIGPNGSVFVVDTGNARVLHIGMDGEVIARLGRRGAEPGLFDEPMGIAVTGRDTILVVDRNNGRVQELAFDGTVKRVIPLEAVKGIGTNEPSIAVAADGTAYVSATLTGEIYRFGPEDAQAELVQTQSVPLDRPTGLLIRDGELLITDTSKHVLRRLPMGSGR